MDNHVRKVGSHVFSLETSIRLMERWQINRKNMYRPGSDYVITSLNPQKLENKSQKFPFIEEMQVIDRTTAF